MTDFFLDLTQNPNTRRLVRALGLRLPLPTRLARVAVPWSDGMLQHRTIAVGGAENGQLSECLGRILAEAKAEAWVVGSERAAAGYRHHGELWQKPVQVLAPVKPQGGRKVDGLLFDATGVGTPDSLRALFEFFQLWLAHIEEGGRAVIVARPPVAADLSQAATRGALEGFVRSLAKETGSRAVHVNLIYIEPGAESRLRAPLLFLLGSVSTFVTGQVLQIDESARACPQGSLSQSLSGKVALVTGAARGIGAKTAEVLAREGAVVVSVDRPAEEANLSAVADRVGGSALLVDITDTAAARTLSRQLRDDYGGVDIVVHNAGITRDRFLSRMRPESWDTVIRVNLSAVVRITEGLLEEQLLRDSGRVVVVSSVSGIAGLPGQTNYSSAKAGLIGFMRSLAQRLGPRGTTANAVAPGFIETRMTESVPVAVRQLARRLSALGQGGTPADVAEAIGFLSLPHADGISGRVLRVCGGAFLGA